MKFLVHVKLDVWPCRIRVLSSHCLLGRAVADESSGEFVKVLERGW